MKKRPKGTTSNYNDNKVEYQYIVPVKIQCVGGIMVSIAAFQAVDPGSIPGRRSKLFFFFKIANSFFIKFYIFAPFLNIETKPEIDEMFSNIFQ